MHQISNIYFAIKLCMFRASSVPIIGSYLLYVRQLVRFMQAMWPLPSRDRLEPSSNKIIACYLVTAAPRSCFSVTPEKNHKIDIHYLFT
jgi:hypothetical protein